MNELFYKKDLLENYPKLNNEIKFKKIELNFGEQLFHQNYYSDQTQLKKIDLLVSDNLSQFLGYNSLIPEDNNK
jgi:hypothetical protein